MLLIGVFAKEAAKDEFVISGTSSKDGSKACAEDAPTKKWYLTATPGGSLLRKAFSGRRVAG